MKQKVSQSKYLVLGSKDLGFMYLDSLFVLLANHDQNNVFKVF